jgi:hypothetical protein
VGRGVCGFRGNHQRIAFVSDGVDPTDEDPLSHGVYDCDPAHCCKLANSYRQKLLELHADEKLHLFKAKSDLAFLAPEIRAGVTVLRGELASVAMVETCADLVQYDARLPRRAAVMASNSVVRDIQDNKILAETLAKVTPEMVGLPAAAETA